MEIHYKDVVLNNPQYSEIKSRDDINIKVLFCGWLFKSPVVPSNMATTIDFQKAEELSENGYFYILHRFYPYEKIVNWLKTTKAVLKSISVGVKEKDYDLIDDIAENKINVDFITVDVAHGHHVLVKTMIGYIRRKLGKNVQIIAGNCCTPEACKDFEEWGANAVKVGLSIGMGCTTYTQTGVGSPMFSTIVKCALESNLPIIADGGIREISDVCKSLVGGSTMVMIGSGFAACVDSPAPDIYDHENNLTHKHYYGSASYYNKGYNKYIEGKENVYLPIKEESYLSYYQRIRDGIASCMSYHNIDDIAKINTIKWSTHNFNQ